MYTYSTCRVYMYLLLYFLACLNLHAARVRACTCNYKQQLLTCTTQAVAAIHQHCVPIRLTKDTQKATVGTGLSQPQVCSHTAKRSYQPFPETNSNVVAGQIDALISQSHACTCTLTCVYMYIPETLIKQLHVHVHACTCTYM